MQRPAQGLGEIAVARRVGSARIIGTAGIGPPQKKIDQLDLILDMNPRHPLPAVTQRSAQAEPVERQQALEETTLGGQHQAGAQQHDTGAELLRLAGDLLPGEA